MIERHHRGPDGTVSRALWSPCGQYRFRLDRRWAPGPPLVAILLNPSTATETQDDPTLRRCLARARAMGLPGLSVVNLFALCATDPAALARHPDPVGNGTDAIVHAAAREAGAILCGWGNHGAHLGRGAAVAGALRHGGHRLLHLGLTLQGQPRHPLYVAATLPARPWTAPATAQP